MSATQLRMIELGLVTKAPRLPSDIALLDSVASLEFCPVKSVSRRVRADYIACLIDSTLVEAGR